MLLGANNHSLSNDMVPDGCALYDICAAWFDNGADQGDRHSVGRDCSTAHGYSAADDCSVAGGYSIGDICSVGKGGDNGNDNDNDTGKCTSTRCPGARVVLPLGHRCGEPRCREMHVHTW